MSKAEEKAMQYCCTKCENNRLNCGMKQISHGRNCIECSNYIEGYHQAEKDNELTWDDMHAIATIEDRLIHELCLNDQTLPHTQEFYEEVLKRFKTKKEESC